VGKSLERGEMHKGAFWSFEKKAKLSKSLKIHHSKSLSHLIQSRAILQYQSFDPSILKTEAAGYSETSLTICTLTGPKQSNLEIYRRENFKTHGTASLTYLAQIADRVADI
jgi:hypothetical protein